MLLARDRILSDIHLLEWGNDKMLKALESMEDPADDVFEKPNVV